MFWKLFQRKLRDLTALFNGHFIEAKSMYALLFDRVPCINVIGELDSSKAFAYIKETLDAETIKTYQHSYFDFNEQQILFNNTVFVLQGKRVIELGPNYCQVLFTPEQYAWAHSFIEALAGFRVVAKEPVIGFARQTAMN